jgi:hypothetical protein
MFDDVVIAFNLKRVKQKLRRGHATGHGTRPHWRKGLEGRGEAALASSTGETLAECAVSVTSQRPATTWIRRKLCVQAATTEIYQQ